MSDPGPATREVTAASVAATDASLAPGRSAGFAAIWVRELRADLLRPRP